MKCPECGYDNVPEGAGFCPMCRATQKPGISVTQNIRKAVNSTVIGVQNILAERDARRYRQLLLERVRNRWFDRDRVILLGAPPIELRMEERLDLLGRQSKRMLPTGNGMAKVFDQAEGKLVILGAPGSGKKEKMLELAYALLERAQDESELMPVVLSLFAWTGEYDADGFFDWLAIGISEMYDGIGTELAKEWLRMRALVLLLYDLDRVERKHQPASIRAINDFIRKWNPVRIVVCSRTTDYEALSPPGLRVHDVVELKSLTPKEVSSYLAGPELAALRTLLDEDPTLQKLAGAPLYLNVMSDVYRGKPVEAIQQLDSLEARCEELWKDYVDCGFEKGIDDGRYNRKETEGWLSWLAQRLREHRQDLFLIERMQPNWLPEGARRWHTIGSWLATALAFGLPVGLALGLAFAEAVGLRQGLGAGLACALTLGLLLALAYLRLENSLSFALTVGFTTGLAVGLGMGLAFGPFRGLAFGVPAAALGLAIGLLPSGVTADRARIKVVETLRWSWPRAILGLVVGAASALAGGAVIGLAFRGLAHGLRIGMFFASFGGPALAVIAGMTGGEIQVEKRERPNEGIRRSAMSAIRVGLGVGLAAGVPVGLGGITTGRIHIGTNIWIGGLYDGLALGLMLGLGLGLAFGGITCIQHAILRLILHIRDPHIPLDLVAFLRYVEGLGFLKRHGGAYEFRHDGLEDYFADLGSEQCAAE